MKARTNPCWGLAAVLAALLLDQVSKSAAHQWVARHGSLLLLPVLDITSGFNTGVAFGMATDTGQPVLILVAAGIVAWLGFFLVKAESRVQSVGAGAIIGGALGNIADRFRFGTVRDFIDFHVGGWHWPTFNLADTSIFVGLALLVLPGVAGAMTRRTGRRGALR